MRNIRNFSIIAHIDHGKSTLADRLLDITGSVEKRKMQEQFLDQMELERERGITIKLQPVRMVYKDYILNLIDTPGHVDFTYEVSRSLAAVEGAILLVDATKGVQAQTIANLRLAQNQGLAIIPVINKIDLQNARVGEVEEEIINLLETDKDKIIKISAKNGTNVTDVLERIISDIPYPEQSKEPGFSGGDEFKALIFDSEFDAYKGIIAFVRVFRGQVSKNDKIYFYASGVKGDALEIGYFIPFYSPRHKISAGDIGYIATGLKDPLLVRVGDTVLKFDQKDENLTPLSGYKEPLPVVFASFYPEDADKFDDLKDALNKLRLTDSSLTFEPESSAVLGRGFRLGFLGMLHVEIISERLKREFGLSLIITAPSVEYHVVLNGGKEEAVRAASNMSPVADIEKIKEPIAELSIIAPQKYLGGIMELLGKRRGFYQITDYLSHDIVRLCYQVPLSEIVSDFYDDLKSLSSGYASMSYEPAGYQEAELSRLDIIVAGEMVEPFSRIVPKTEAYKIGRLMVEKLKKVIPSQLFAVPIQAAIGGKIIARETIRAMRKDVTGYLYGGDVTRKMKLLEKQKKGKKKLKEIGKVKIPQKAFLEMLKK